LSKLGWQSPIRLEAKDEKVKVNGRRGGEKIVKVLKRQEEERKKLMKHLDS
jgi:hypothetical protein